MQDTPHVGRRCLPEELLASVKAPAGCWNQPVVELLRNLVKLEASKLCTVYRGETGRSRPLFSRVTVTANELHHAHTRTTGVQR